VSKFGIIFEDELVTEPAGDCHDADPLSDEAKTAKKPLEYLELGSGRGLQKLLFRR